MALRISSPFGLLSRGASAPARLEAETSHQNTHICQLQNRKQRGNVRETDQIHNMPIVDDAIISVT